LADAKELQLGLFDRRNLAELTSAAYPGERLIACYNPDLAAERRRKRAELLDATEEELEKVARQVARRTRTPLSPGEIGQKVGRVINRYKVAKHFRITIEKGSLRWERKAKSIAREQELDGIYVVRTSEPSERLSAEETVRGYKRLALVERLFRCLKTIDVRVRPIRHREERRVRAHIFLCVLAYYVEWHMRKALAPLLFDDECLEEDRRRRDPVLAAAASESAKAKRRTRTNAGGQALHSFETLLAELGTRCRNRCRVRSQPDAPPFDQLTAPTPLQQRALELLGLL